jgi:hypothetical protein
MIQRCLASFTSSRSGVAAVSVSHPNGIRQFQLAETLAKFRVVAIGGIGQHRRHRDSLFYRFSNLFQSNLRLSLKHNLFRYPAFLPAFPVLGPNLG